MAASAVDLAAMAGKGAINLGTQRVIGVSRTTTKSKKNSQVTESMNIGIQAWELGIILAAIAAYDWVEGAGQFMNGFWKSLDPLNWQWSSPSNPALR